LKDLRYIGIVFEKAKVLVLQEEIEQVLNDLNLLRARYMVN